MHGKDKRRTAKGMSSLLDQSLNYRISMVELLLMRSSGAFYTDEAGLTTHQWKCLAAVGVWGPMQAFQVVRHATLDKAAVSRAVRQLVDLGYLEESQHSRDRRMVTLALTKQGRKVFESITGKIHRLQLMLLKGVSTAEQDQFFRTLLHIEDKLRTLQNLPSRSELNTDDN
jgi:DNA-binding MarR family transcriptional regulator